MELLRAQDDLMVAECDRAEERRKEEAGHERTHDATTRGFYENWNRNK
jgi:hypothetical protein